MPLLGKNNNTACGSSQHSGIDGRTWVPAPAPTVTRKLRLVRKNKNSFLCACMTLSKSPNLAGPCPLTTAVQADPQGDICTEPGTR